MKQLLIFILIITVSCAEQENISEKLGEDYPLTRVNSKTRFYIFEASRELQIELNGKPKTIKINTSCIDEDDKEEIYDFDTLGRVNKHRYTEYERVNGKKKSIPIVEIFLYHSDNNKLLEQIKYENEKQILRELFLYRNGLRTHHYILDSENKLMNRAEYLYDENQNIFMIEEINQAGYMNIEQHEYHSNGVQSKFVWRGSKEEIIEVRYNEKRSSIYNEIITYSPHKGYYSDDRTKDKLENTPLVEQNPIYENLGKEEIITSDSTKKIIYKERHHDIISEKIIEKTYDKFENCVSSKIYKNGTLQKTTEIEIEYFDEER